jgi:predicted DCC family thiol-disulfide oxidoreductase YuxK
MIAEAKSTIASGLSRLREMLSEPHRLIGVSLLRIALGLNILVFYITHLYERHYLWGDDGLVPFSTFLTQMHAQRNLSLYQLSTAPAYENALFFGGLLVTIAFILGFKTRPSSILFFIFTWSLYTRDQFVMTAGDNLLYLIIFLMMFCDCGAYFSIDAADAAARGDIKKKPRPFVSLLHNFGVLAILLQLSLLYLTSAFYKISGHMWQDGTALYYVLRTSEFNLSPLAHFLYQNVILVTALTYFTILFQLAWPFLIWSRAARPFVALGAFALHANIGYFMGLVWFSAVLISAELIIFDDLDYRRFARFCDRTFDALARSWTNIASQRIPRKWAIEVIYDGDCPMCGRIVDRWARSLDWLRLLGIASFRARGFVPPDGVTLADLEKRMYVSDGHGVMSSGIDAVWMVATRLPLLWIALPLIWISRKLGFGRALYDLVAANRMMLPVGHCAEAACAPVNERPRPSPESGTGSF